MIVPRGSLSAIDFEGLSVFDYTAGQVGPSSVALIQVSPGIGHREAYSKRSDKYYYLIVGRLEFVVDGETYDLGPGDLCHVPQGTPFAYRNHTDSPATTLLVHTPPFDLADEVFVNQGRR